MTFQIASLLVLSIILTAGLKVNANSLAPRVHATEEIDFIILRQIWPPATCMFPGAHTCSIAHNISTWVVHGLWPSENHKIGPSFCNKTMPFDFNRIKWLLPRLLEFWPNLYTDSPLDSFWQHEWDKHGTCALGLSGIKCESDYFNATLALRDNYDLSTLMKDSGVIPDDTLLYDLDKIIHAIQLKLNVLPQLTCYILKESEVQYLSQLQLCFSKDFKLIECSEAAVEMGLIKNSNAPQQTHCQPGLPIHYPTIHYATKMGLKI